VTGRFMTLSYPTGRAISRSPAKNLCGKILLMARRGVQYQADVRDQAGPAVPRSVPRWWRGPDPDPAVVCRLYVQDGRTETEIAVLLSISRARVAAVLRDAGIPRRTSRKDCPVEADTLREIVQDSVRRSAGLWSC